jgi:hypothetical protein
VQLEFIQPGKPVQRGSSKNIDKRNRMSTRLFSTYDTSGQEKLRYGVISKTTPRQFVPQFVVVPQILPALSRTRLPP